MGTQFFLFYCLRESIVQRQSIPVLIGQRQDGAADKRHACSAVLATRSSRRLSFVQLVGYDSLHQGVCVCGFRAVKEVVAELSGEVET